MSDQPNANEGADPSGDVKQQNPGGTTTDDLAKDSGKRGTDGNDATKTQDLTKAGREDMDPNAGQE